MSATKGVKQNLVVFHTAYNYKTISKLGLEIFITSRNASKVFDKVITINPVSDLQNYILEERLDFHPRAFHLDETNLVIEGFSKRYTVLNNWPKLNFLLAQFSLFRFILKGDFLRGVKLVRGEDPRFNGLYALLISRILRKPLIIGVWGNPKRLRKLNQVPIMPRVFPSIRLEEILEKFVIRRSDLVLAQNRENLSYALDFGAESLKTRITPLGIGIDKIHFVDIAKRRDFSAELNELGISGALIFLCISRLEKLKMVNHAILACSIVAKAGIDFKLVIIGDGSEKHNLIKLAEDLQIASSVIFLGNQSQAYIAGLASNSYLNIAPLCGRALLEASLSGCPAVAYNVDWHSEIVIDGETGRLVENLEYERMAEAIKDLCRSQLYRNELSKNMRNLALKIGHPDNLVTAQRDYYEELLLPKVGEN
jgi:glycosyltransferase involved in cell wall biosynthesis